MFDPRNIRYTLPFLRYDTIGGCATPWRPPARVLSEPTWFPCPAHHACYPTVDSRRPCFKERFTIQRLSDPGNQTHPPWNSRTNGFAPGYQLGLEHLQRPMTANTDFPYIPGEHEAEKASNSYLMSLIAVMAGMPIPIINLVATVAFYLGNRNGTYFVRWHCTQALLSQVSLLFVNSYGFWWTISIIFSDATISNEYISYIITVVIFNIVEFIATIFTAIKTRNGHHVQWWFYGGITNAICKA